MKRMKLLIFCIVACCLVTAGTAMAYTASGKVYDSTTTTLVPVANPTGTISEGVAVNSITGQTNGSYSGGWSSANLVGKTITVNAQKGNASGSKSWLAQTNTETGKDVLIKSNIAINPALKARLEPVQFAAAGTQPPSSAVVQVNEGGGTIPVDGFTAQITYNANQMSFASIIDIDSFFDITAIDLSGEVTVTGIANSGSVLLIEGPPRELFAVEWNVSSFDTRDLTVVDLQLSVGATEPNMAVPHQTEYVIGDISKSEPYFLIASECQWNEAIDGDYIKGLTTEEWEGYILQWGDSNNIHDGNEPYPDTNFIPPVELYVYEGNGDGELDPCDAGLVMGWGEPAADGNYASAFKFDFKKDPDLSNCTITVQVTAPQFPLIPPPSPPPPPAITQVSLGLQNIPIVGGPVRSWYWNVGPGTSIPWNTPTTITIDTSKTGVAATTPTATSSVSNPGFNIQTVQWIIVDENATWVGGLQNAPPPGGGIPGMWNYWHNLSVTPNTSGTADSKWYVKYSQPPVVIEPSSDPPLINGWDEISDYNNLPDPIMADDWLCEDKRPITDIHWWGSYIGWTQPYPPPIVPKAFHIGIWTDVPVSDPVVTYSHPGTLVWENYCTSTVWNFAGYDLDPFERPEHKNEACFQYAQFFSQDEWFYQEPNESGTNVYWLSIAAVYDAQDYADPNFYPWGWKTRPHKFNDDACSITSVVSGVWPPQLLDVWLTGDELIDPDGFSWDLAFELTTNEPSYEDEPIPGDIASAGGGPPDGIVNFFDIAKLLEHWLDTAP